jgi:hypothetical protein
MEKSKTGKRIFTLNKTSNLSVKDGHVPVEDKFAAQSYGKKMLPHHENPNPIQIYDNLDIEKSKSSRSCQSTRGTYQGEASFRPSKSRSRLGLIDDHSLSSVRTVDSSYSNLSFDELEQKRTSVARELERLERILNGSEQYTG